MRKPFGVFGDLIGTFGNSSVSKVPMARPAVTIFLLLTLNFVNMAQVPQTPVAALKNRLAVLEDQVAAFKNSSPLFKSSSCFHGRRHWWSLGCRYRLHESSPQIRSYHSNTGH